MNQDVRRLGESLWELPMTGKMRVPVRLYVSEAMLRKVFGDNAPQQAMNVACLPGIVWASLAMPDLHWGYGFPIGGVAAFDLEEGVVSPGGVGYDINCGVRLMSAAVSRREIEPRVGDLVDRLFAGVPSGVGSSGAIGLNRAELRRVAVEGAGWCVQRGIGEAADLAHIEEEGRMAEADPTQVSDRAWQRGEDQVGTLGSGNHFLEIGYVSEVFDVEAARVMGLDRDRVTVTIHCGSRGFGHQICDDFLTTMDRAARKHHIELPDRQLACAPVRSPEGQAYLGAMRCAVNYAFANRQAIAHRVREIFAAALGSRGEQALRTVYEVAHNIAKLETHEVGGRSVRLCVHRKGATRAFAAGAPDVPADYRSVGQPVLVPGDMGRCSYVLVGTERGMREAFGSACHGAGRAMSRQSALRQGKGRDIVRELAESGVRLRAKSRQTIAEEMPDAYKDVTEVVDACVSAGIARKVVQIKPLGCVKG
jgi:tRNA-splicing ligase RtcB